MSRTSVLKWYFPVFFDGMQNVWVILSHEYRCFHCRRHKHSQNHRTFVNVLHWIFWRTVQHLSQERSDSAAVSESISISMTNTSLAVLVPDISPDFLTWQDHLSSLFQSEEFGELASNTGLPVLVCCTFNELRGTFWLSDLVFTGLSDAIEVSTFGSLTRCRDTKFIIGFWFCCDSFFTCIFLCSFRHRLTHVDGAEMANGENTQKMVPLITCEISLCLPMVFDLDLGVRIDSVKQPIKSNSVSSGNVSHCLASSLQWSS